MTRRISIARDFSKTPGGRFRKHGPHSGEEFRETLLVPAVSEAMRCDDLVEVNFDGVAGMPSSFMEEAFGGLIRRKPEVAARRVLTFTATDPALQPYVHLAQRYFREAAERATKVPA